MLSKKSFSPRVMMRFLQLSFERAQEYYLDNPGEDKKVLLDEKNEYPVIKKQCMFDAYKLIISKTINWTLNKARRYSEEWNEILLTYFNSINKNSKFTLEHFCEKLDCNTDEARVIMAFLENVGAVRCYKPNRRNWEKSIYGTSLFYRAYAYHSDWNI